MLQPEKFICISYSQIDFLIPNDEVVSAVGLTDFDPTLMQGSLTGIYDFDAIAAKFQQTPSQTNIRTMVVLNDEGEEKVSVVTTRECRVCTISLENFSLFSDAYFENLHKIGVLACSFEENKIRYLLNVKQTIQYMSGLEKSYD